MQPKGSRTYLSRITPLPALLMPPRGKSLASNPHASTIATSCTLRSSCKSFMASTSLLRRIVLWSFLTSALLGDSSEQRIRFPAGRPCQPRLLLTHPVGVGHHACHEAQPLRVVQDHLAGHRVPCTLSPQLLRVLQEVAGVVWGTRPRHSPVTGDDRADTFVGVVLLRGHCEDEIRDLCSAVAGVQESAVLDFGPLQWRVYEEFPPDGDPVTHVEPSLLRAAPTGRRPSVTWRQRPVGMDHFEVAVQAGNFSRALSEHRS